MESLEQGAYSRRRRMGMRPQTVQTAGDRPAGRPVQPSAGARPTAQDTPPSRSRHVTTGHQTAGDRFSGRPATTLASILLSSQDIPLSWSRRLAMISPTVGDRFAGGHGAPSTSTWLTTQDTPSSKDRSLTAGEGSSGSSVTLDTPSHRSSQDIPLSTRPEQKAGEATIGPLTKSDTNACLIIQECPRSLGRRFTMGPHRARDRALKWPTLPDGSTRMTTEESTRRRSRRFSEMRQSAGEGAAGPRIPPVGVFLRAQEHARIKKPLSKKKAMCDFRVRWPEVIEKAKEKEEDETFDVQSEAPSSACSSVSRLALSITDFESCPYETATQPDLAETQEGLPDDATRRSSQKSPYMTILDSYLNPETLTRRERRVKKRTVAKLKQLEEDIEAAKRRQKEQLEKSRVLQEELAHNKAASKPFLELLQQKNNECQRKHDDLWDEYIQECWDIQNRRKELAVTYALQSATLQKQLMEGRKIQANLNKQLTALKPIALIKEGQDKTIQALQEEIEKLPQETFLKDRETHLQFLQAKAALEKQLEEMNQLELGENITQQLKKKAKTFEKAAKKAHQEFCENIRQQSRQLQEDLWHMEQEWRKLEATKEWLEKQKQWCKEEQWYLEALTRGRGHLQELQELPSLNHQDPRRQSGPDTTQGSSLGTKSRATPGPWLPSLRK